MSCAIATLQPSLEMPDFMLEQFEMYAKAVRDGITTDAFTPCDVIDELLDIVSVPKGGTPFASASATLYAFARLASDAASEDAANDDKEVILKIGFASQDASTDNSLDSERAIYRQVTNGLLFQRASPHLPMYMGELACHSFQRWLSTAASSSGDSGDSGGSGGSGGRAAVPAAAVRGGRRPRRTRAAAAISSSAARTASSAPPRAPGPACGCPAPAAAGSASGTPRR